MTKAETAPYSDSVGAPASDCALDAEPEELRRMYHRAVWDYVTGRTEGIPAHAPASESAPSSDSVAASFPQPHPRRCYHADVKRGDLVVDLADFQRFLNRFASVLLLKIWIQLNKCCF